MNEKEKAMQKLLAASIAVVFILGGGLSFTDCNEHEEEKEFSDFDNDVPPAVDGEGGSNDAGTGNDGGGEECVRSPIDSIPGDCLEEYVDCTYHFWDVLCTRDHCSPPDYEGCYPDLYYQYEAECYHQCCNLLSDWREHFGLEKEDVWENSGLMWQNFNIPCHDWDDAKNYCQDLIWGRYSGWSGYGDWRLPMIDELSSLIQSSPDAGGCYLPLQLNGTCQSYWSSSETGLNAQYVNFDSGNVGWHNKDTYNFVRCVR